MGYGMASACYWSGPFCSIPSARRCVTRCRNGATRARWPFRSRLAPTRCFATVWRNAIVRAQKRDTIKAPMAHAEIPVEIGIAQTLRWTRDSIFATGAVTLADLLTRVPGVTVYHAGWIGAPAVATYLGDFRQVRVFFDGVEIPVLDPRARRRPRPDADQHLGRRGNRHRAGAAGDSRLYPNLARAHDARPSRAPT